MVPVRNVCRLVKVAWPYWLRLIVLIRLELLKPGAETELVRTARQGYTIFIGIQIAIDIQVASVVASGQAYLRLRVRCRAAAHHHRTNQPACQKTRNVGRRCARGWFAGKEVACP